MPRSALSSDSCYGRALVLANALGEFAASREASEDDCEKTRRVALALFPLLFFMVDDQQIKATARSLSLCATFFNDCGAAGWALRRCDLPKDLREEVFPVLMPDRHQQIACWWHEVARPGWVEGFFASRRSRALICELLADRCPMALAPSAYGEWQAAQRAVWPAAITTRISR